MTKYMVYTNISELAGILERLKTEFELSCFDRIKNTTEVVLIIDEDNRIKSSYLGVS